MSEPIRDPEGIETQHLHALVDLGRASVLEIGAGDGRLTWRYARTAGQVAAIDINAERLALGRQARPATLAQAVSFMQATATELPFRDAGFRVAILAWSL